MRCGGVVGGAYGWNKSAGFTSIGGAEGLRNWERLDKLPGERFFGYAQNDSKEEILTLAGSLFRRFAPYDYA